MDKITIGLLCFRVRACVRCVPPINSNLLIAAFRVRALCASFRPIMQLQAGFFN